MRMPNGIELGGEGLAIGCRPLPALKGPQA